MRTLCLLRCWVETMRLFAACGCGALRSGVIGNSLTHGRSRTHMGGALIRVV